MLRHWTIVLAFSLVFAHTASALENKDEAKQEEAIKAVVATLEKGFNDKNAKALADCWTENGEFFGPHGKCIEGRQNIEAAFEKYFSAHKECNLHWAVLTWRPVADNVALVDLASEMTPLPEGIESQPTSALVLVKQDGKWLVDRMHEAQSGQFSHNIQLRRLSGMVGDWVETNTEPGEAVMHSSCSWTKNGAYLIRKFSAETPTGVAMAGTEVIGWDPRTHRIHSWTFDSNGGFGESIWTRDGNRWQVAYTGVLANGDDVVATHIATIDNPDEFTVQTVDREVNGEKLSDLPPVTFKRRKAEEPTAVEPAKLPNQVLPQVR